MMVTCDLKNGKLEFHCEMSTGADERGIHNICRKPATWCLDGEFGCCEECARSVVKDRSRLKPWSLHSEPWSAEVQ